MNRPTSDYNIPVTLRLKRLSDHCGPFGFPCLVAERDLATLSKLNRQEITFLLKNSSLLKIVGGAEPIFVRLIEEQPMMEGAFLFDSEAHVMAVEVFSYMDMESLELLMSLGPVPELKPMLDSFHPFDGPFRTQVASTVLS